MKKILFAAALATLLAGCKCNQPEPVACDKPCCTDSTDSFRVMVALPWGTNTGIPEGFETKTPEDSLLWARNKWLLAHADSAEAGQGALVRLTGPNIDLAQN